MDPLVSIICTSYNHEAFLRQCLDGFIMQNTNFHYEVIIHDDASTDLSQTIIREYCLRYPDVFVPIFQTENQYSQGVRIGPAYMYPLAKGKYIAECEGDDYWIDSNKLQKQVDFLESHPDYSMCFHSAWNQYGTNPELTDLFSKVEDRDYSSLDILSNWIIPTASVVYRQDVITDIFYREKVLKAGFMFGDTPLFLSCARMGKVRGISDVMSVYRRHEKGESNNKENTIHVKLETYYEKLGQVFGLEKIGNSIVATLKFDAFLESVKKRHIEWHTLADLLFHTPFLFAKCVCNRLVTLFNKK